MNDKIEKEVQILPPFKKFCMTIGELPSSYLETMTYYEMLVWFCNYLGKTVIPTIDNNAEAVIELQTLFVELQTYVNDYFDNLDVQEEIDNKLDDMVEQGTLQEIIADYLNSKAVFGFDTVALMKSSTNLIDGSYARTLGYYSINDGGSGLYKIREITNSDVIDEGSIIAIGTDDLIAELVPENNCATPNQFGAYGDGTHDDINALNKCKNYCITNNITFKGVSKSIYGISEGFTIETGASFDFDLATVKALTTMSYVIRHRKTANAHVEPINNETTKNIIIDCDNKADYGFYQDMFGWSVLVDNIRVLNPLEIGIYIQVGQIRLYNSKVEQMDTTVSCVGVQVESGDSEFYNIVTRECTTGIKIDGQANSFNECHPVIFNATIENSAGFEISQQTSLVNCFADTFMYGIKITREIADINILNFRNAINTDYYTALTASKAPYVIYFTSDNVNWTSHITMSGTFCNSGKVYGDEYTKFSNVSKWCGSSLLLNNSMLNRAELLPNVPKEIRQIQANINISSLLNSTTSADNANIVLNGNTCYLRLENLVLPAITANSTYDIILQTNPIPTRLIPDSTIQYGCTTLNGVFGRLVVYTNGRIGFYPYSDVSANDKLYIYLPYMK